MRRYPEADLTGEIVSVTPHPTIRNVTILRVRRTHHADARLTSIYLFERMKTIDGLEGRCLRADVLALPHDDPQSDDTGPLVAMEWCIHEKDGRAVECSAGWADHVEGRQYIKLTPPQA